MDTLKALTLVGLNLGVLLTALLDRLSDALSLVLLLGLAGVGFVYLWRRHPRTGPPDHEPASKAVYILEKKPTGLSLEGLRQRFQAAVESVLLGARLAYLYAPKNPPEWKQHFIGHHAEVLP